MIRKLVLAALAAIALGMVEVPTRAAPPISPNNPYRSFNLSGVNYGSMRWEQTHRGRGNVARRGWGARGGGLLFRRR